VAACPTGALSIVDEGLQVDLAVCAYCGECEEICPKEAVRLPYQVIWLDD
jgi:dissimilatory sulfite reductase (desulfoviridin) alpha/beta subunit